MAGLVSIIKIGNTLGNCHLRQDEAILPEKSRFRYVWSAASSQAKSENSR
jgi:hypothetical protein